MTPEDLQAAADANGWQTQWLDDGRIYLNRDAYYIDAYFDESRGFQFVDAHVDVIGNQEGRSSEDQWDALLSVLTRPRTDEHNLQWLAKQHADNARTYFQQLAAEATRIADRIKLGDYMPGTHRLGEYLTYGIEHLTKAEVLADLSRKVDG